MKYFTLVMLLVLFVGCEVQTTEQELGFAPSPTQVDELQAELTMEFQGGPQPLLNGQVIEYVNYYNFDDWLKEHRGNVWIQSMASVNRGGHGFTTGFMIVYSQGE